MTFQLESIYDRSDEGLQRVEQLVYDIGSLGMSVGICFRPDTNVSDLQDVLLHLKKNSLRIDAVNVLAVQPGIGGQLFDISVLDKVKLIHEMFPDLPNLIVDGGVDEKTAELAVQNGANVLVIGTDIFGRYRANQKR